MAETGGQMQAQIVYLACPYTDPDPTIRELRFHRATVAAAHLIEQGLVVYSPITMTHPIDLVLADEGQTMGSDYWVRFDESFMAACERMIVLKLEGWENSNGIKREIAWFKEQGRAVEYLEWGDIKLSRDKPSG